MRERLSYSNVVATLALIIAVAGIPTAVAVTDKAGKNSVTSKSIKDGSVTGKDLAGVRVESRTASGNSIRLDCQPGEQLLSGGGFGAGAFNGSYPTLEGSGWEVTPGGGSVYTVCLRATPGK